jgi:hypothetical protein
MGLAKKHPSQSRFVRHGLYYVLTFFVFVSLVTALWPLHRFQAIAFGVVAVAMSLFVVGVVLLVSLPLQHCMLRRPRKLSRVASRFAGLWDDQLDS